MKLKNPMVKIGVKAPFKGKAAKLWILLFMALISIMAVLCGTVYIVNTVRNFNIASNQLKVNKEQLKALQENRDLTARELKIMEANESKLILEGQGKLEESVFASSKNQLRKFQSLAFLQI
jgi:hypothetical protein